SASWSSSLGCSNRRWSVRERTPLSCCGRRRSLRRFLEASVGLGGGVPAEGLAWSAVELCGDAVEGSAVVAGEVGAFGEVLADESDGVFGGAALPGPAGVAEVDLDAGVDGEADVLGEFFALVPGQ